MPLISIQQNCLCMNLFTLALKYQYINFVCFTSQIRYQKFLLKIICILVDVILWLLNNAATFNNINIMMGPDRHRHLEYSSLVMGSKEVPMITFPSKRNNQLNTKSFSKKTEKISNKYAKGRSNRIRTHNERPDIFLEGEQVCNLKMAWNKNLDIKYLETYKANLQRRTTPISLKNRQGLTKGIIKSQGHCKAQKSQQNAGSNKFQKSNEAYIPRGLSNTVFQNVQRSNLFAQSTERQRALVKLISQQKPQLRLRVSQRIQLRKSQADKIIMQQSKRKQLFYINQKDLNGIRAQSFIVVEYPSLQIITGYYYRKVVEIASLTKIMTFYASIRLLILFELDAENQIVQIDQKAVQIGGTSAQLYEGDRYTVMQLLHALMLPSGNDAALALERWGSLLLGQGSKGFINYMNKLANEIGLKYTTYANPHGLPNLQTGSTAEDISILIARCLQFGVFRQVIKCKEYRCWIQNEGKKRQVMWQNTNKLLRRPGFQGVKTGVTATAGPCLATLYNISGRSFIVVLLRTNKLSRRFKQTRLILSLSLRKLNNTGFQSGIRQLNRNDADLDSDNSEEEEEFNFQKNDASQYQRRKKILLNQL